mgnify:CR=1 FL=1
MSNKLVKNKKQKEILNRRQKKILFFGILIILMIAFLGVWGKIIVTSNAFKTQMESMVEGKDYFLEDIEITDKRSEAVTTDDSISENYFFYYQNGRRYDYDKRMQVPGKIYSEYHVGDTITAYTTDHVSYSYYKYGILPKNEYTNNEIMKCVGVLLLLIFLVYTDLSDGDAAKYTLSTIYLHPVPPHTFRENYLKNNLREPTIMEIASEIGMEKEEIVYALDAIQSPMSLYEPVYTEGGDTLYVMDQVSDKKNKEENWVENLALQDAMNRLSDRERHIVNLRFYEGKTQMEVAHEIGISQAQVSRLEKNALRVMRNYLR